MKKMTHLKNKNKISTIALTILLTISAFFIAFPVATAQESFPTFPYIGALPNPVGVNQMVLLHVGITFPTPSAQYGWHGLSVTIQRPDGEIDTISNINTDSTGGTGATYTPTMTGIYRLQTHFPEQTMPADLSRWGIPAGSIMLASESAELELEVQQNAIEYYPGHSLPNEYWTRPIDAQLREWSAISGSWVVQPPNLIAPGNDNAPMTAHILWTKPLQIGGLVGGEFDGRSYETGDAYEGLFGWPVIISGVLYYNQYKENGGTDVDRYVVAVDLHTGEELWAKHLIGPDGVNRRLAFGQIFHWDGYNYHGAFPYLWTVDGSTWDAFNPFDGRWEYRMTNVPDGAVVYVRYQGRPRINFDQNQIGPKGEIYRYIVDLDEGWMALWNSTKVGATVGSWGSAVVGRTLDAMNGIEWNVSIPTGLPGDVVAILDDRVIGATLERGRKAIDGVTFWALSLEPSHRGTKLFEKTSNPSVWNKEGLILETIAWSSESEDGVYVVGSSEAFTHYGFSVETGEFLWDTEPEIYSNWYGSAPGERGAVIVDDKLISVGVGGIAYAYDIETGDRLWTYHAEDPYQEYLFANDWWIFNCIYTDGKLYLGHTEHSPIDPRPRGGPFICLDIDNGEVIWRADGLFRQSIWGGRAVMGDSIIATQDLYDQRIYAVGKGASVVTLDKTGTVAELGSAFTIQGTVMDVSPGTQDDAMKLRFPNGVPAVSDTSQSDWMLYVYKHFERPDVTGVTIKIEVVTPSGEYKNLGTTTSDAYGNWAFGICPEEAGTYMIIATFEGSAAYYGSTQTGYLTVADPVSPVVDLTSLEDGQSSLEEGQSNLTMYVLVVLVISILALIIAVILLLKSRK